MFVLMGDLLRKYNISSKMDSCLYQRSKYLESITYVCDDTKYVITSCTTYVRVDVLNGRSNISFSFKNIDEFVVWSNESVIGGVQL